MAPIKKNLSKRAWMISPLALDSTGLCTHEGASTLSKDFKYHWNHTFIQYMAAWPFFELRTLIWHRSQLHAAKIWVNGMLFMLIISHVLRKPSAVKTLCCQCRTNFSRSIFSAYLTYIVFRIYNETFLIHCYLDYKQWFTKLLCKKGTKCLLFSGPPSPIPSCNCALTSENFHSPLCFFVSVGRSSSGSQSV